MNPGGGNNKRRRGESACVRDAGRLYNVTVAIGTVVQHARGSLSCRESGTLLSFWLPPQWASFLPFGPRMPHPPRSR